MSNIFVFGSNRAGIHGAGSAKEALENHGAIWGRGEGLQGLSYGIPTKDSALHTLPLSEIAHHVAVFLKHAREHPQNVYNVVRIGTGLAGYSDHHIAPMFATAPENVVLPSGWRKEPE